MADKKKAAPKKAAATNALTAKEQEAVAEALADIFAGRTSPTRVADNCLAIWKATTPRKKWQDENWARFTSGFGA